MNETNTTENGKKRLGVGTGILIGAISFATGIGATIGAQKLEQKRPGTIKFWNKKSEDSADEVSVETSKKK